MSSFKPDDWSALKGRVHGINEKPIQRPGKHQLLRELQIGGPTQDLDTRMFLEVKDLAMLLEVARCSPMQRVVLNRVGVHVKVWQTPAGHNYETWELISLKPKPEGAP
jgi:hypothetical protein